MVANMPAAANVITAVAIQPTVFSIGGSGKRPITVGRLPSSIGGRIEARRGVQLV